MSDAQAKSMLFMLAFVWAGVMVLLSWTGSDWLAVYCGVISAYSMSGALR